jgi:hypothetical protein
MPDGDRAHPEPVRRSFHRSDDVGLPGRLPEVEQAAVLLAAATVIAVLVLLAAALLPPESHPAPARPPPSTRTALSGQSAVPTVDGLLRRRNAMSR